MLTDIFPLAVGHKFINISYALDSNNLPVAGSEYRVVTRLAGVESIQGRNATILADSTFNADGTLKKVDTLYVAKAANGQDLDALIPLHNITQGQANDRWCTFVKPVRTDQFRIYLFKFGYHRVRLPFPTWAKSPDASWPR